MEKNTEQLCINTIRTLSMDAVQKADSGHPGTPMGMAPVVFTIYDRFMKFNPRNTHWVNRDRFILSAGHASMMLYSILHITGHDVTLDDIKLFRQLHSKCPGHPEYGLTPGVETTTGPLGQGLATSVGFAIAQKWLASHFNKQGFNLIDYRIFSLAGDGCMMEGISSEAASLAGHLGLDNLIWIYDSNHITIEGNTSLAFSEDVAGRFEAYGWNVQKVKDANDQEMFSHAVRSAENTKGCPSLIIVNSHIAYGAPNKQDTKEAHGSPLGEEEIRATKKFYGWNPDKNFFVPEEVKQYASKIAHRGKKQNDEWDNLFAAYKKNFPELAVELELMLRNELPDAWDVDTPSFKAGTEISGRVASSKVMNAIASRVPFLIGGSADLSPSTKTEIKDETSFQKGNFNGRNLHFGIREHAMNAAANGMSLSGLRTYTSTFLTFSDYGRGAIRLTALMKLPVIYIFTHDSIGLGEDGPTHQPIEQLASLRAMPNLEVIRPADANEVSVLWKYIMESKSTPIALVLSRQDLPVFDRTKYAPAEGALKGAYILADSQGKPDIILIATGSEVHLAVDAYEVLKQEGINARLVSMPDWKLFKRQSTEYRESVLPSKVKARVAIEAGSTFGWSDFVDISGQGEVIGMQTFGASGNIDSLLEEFGFTVKNIVNVSKSVMNKSQKTIR